MRVFKLAIEEVNALRSWFHPKDRSVIMANDTFIEGEETATPANPAINRGRLYWKNRFWTQLNSSGIEQPIGGPALIAETILSASTTSVTFSGIPQIFRHLMLVCQARSDAAAEVDNILIRFNSDSGANYDFEQLFGNAATPTSTASRATASLPFAIIEAANSRASNFAPAIGYVFGYTLSDREKWFLSNSATFGNVSADADMFVVQRSGRWRNPTAISSVSLLPGTGPNFVSGSRFQLYGVN